MSWISFAQIIGTITLLAALVAIYKFFLQKPALTLSVRSRNHQLLNDETFQYGVDFYISNDGLDFAEDAYVEMEIDTDMDTADGLRISHEGTTTAFSIDLDHDCMAAHLAPELPGEYHVFSVNDIIYRNKEFQLHSGGIQLEEENICQIEYSTACRSHQPRTGTIRLRIDSDEQTISVENEQPFYLRRLLAEGIIQFHRLSRNAINSLR